MSKLIEARSHIRIGQERLVNAAHTIQEQIVFSANNAYRHARYDYQGREIPTVDPRDRLATAVVDTIMLLRVPTILTEGIKNVESFETSLNEDSVGIIILNHNSHVDHALLEQALARNGRKRLRRRLTYPLGTSLQGNKTAQFVNHMVSTIPVWPNFRETQNAEEEEAKKDMNRRGLMASARSFLDGRVVVLYPEGTRGKPGEPGEPGEMGFADEGTESYLKLLKNKEMLILPVSIVGAEIILPKGKGIPIDYPAQIIFGEPLRRSELLALYDGLPKDLKYKMMMRHVMLKVAENLPESNRGLYGYPTFGYTPGILEEFEQFQHDK